MLIIKFGEPMPESGRTFNDDFIIPESGRVELRAYDGDNPSWSEPNDGEGVVVGYCNISKKEDGLYVDSYTGSGQYASILEDIIGIRERPEYRSLFRPGMQGTVDRDIVNPGATLVFMYILIKEVTVDKLRDLKLKSLV